MIIELILTAVVFLITCIFLTRKPKGMPPGEWGLPIIGRLPSSDLPLTEHVEIYKKKYGKTFLWKMGSRRIVFLCDYKVLKAVFATAPSAYRPDVYSLDIFSDYNKLGFVNNNGHSWMNLRRFSVRYLKDQGMGKSSIEDVIMYELECLIEDFKKQTGKPVEVPWSLNVAIINILWKILADKRYDVENKEIQDFERLVTDVFNDAQQNVVVMFDLFPFLVPIIPHFIKLKFGLAGCFERIKIYQAFLKSAIDDHIATLDEDNPRDFIDSFLIEMNANEKGKGTEKTDTFSYKELLFALSDMFGAGSETMSSTVRWILLFMAKYPDVQRKVQEEIDNVVPRDRLPNLNDKDKLVYTTAMINEVMRLAPISPFGVHHCANEDITIENYRIPKGTLLVSGIMSCHLDPDYWEDPKEFKPERFIAPDGNVDLKKEGFVAFSTGRRLCPGEGLARTELFLFVSGLLHKFRFSAPAGVELETSPNVEKPIFMIPNPFKIIISDRDQKTEQE